MQTKSGNITKKVKMLKSYSLSNKNELKILKNYFVIQLVTITHTTIYEFLK